MSESAALRPIQWYFSNRTERVQIDGIMSDFSSLLLQFLTTIVLAMRYL